MLLSCSDDVGQKLFIHLSDSSIVHKDVIIYFSLKLYAIEVRFGMNMNALPFKASTGGTKFLYFPYFIKRYNGKVFKCPG